VGARSSVLALALAALGCEAAAAGPTGDAELEPAQTETETRPPATAESSAAELEMPALQLGDQALPIAEDPIAPLWGAGALPRHTPGELPRWIEHQTIPRETVEALALRYGVHARQIRKWNDMGANEELHRWRSQTLRIHAQAYPPPRVALRYTVVAGDSWAAIARRHGVHDRHLRAWNVSEVGRSLEPGEVIDVWVDPIVYAAIQTDDPASARAALVRPGAHGVGVPQDGELIVGVQLPPGPGYRLRYPNSAYGTTWAVRQTVSALDRFVAATDHPYPISVGTMSRMRGGEIGHHVSHQTGRDLDIRLPLRAEVPQALNPTARRVDWELTWELVHAFAKTEGVEVIFLDYQRQRRLYRAAEAKGVDEATLEQLVQFPRGWGASLGLVRHSPGHEGHIHVRFSCGPAEPLCGDL